jgi:putative addiction module component (TIGR02574 family)
MSPQLLAVERQAAHLAPKDREILAERLIQSLDAVPLTDVEEAWVKEAERRFTAWRRGERKGIPAARAMRQIRGELGL